MKVKSILLFAFALIPIQMCVSYGSETEAEKIETLLSAIQKAQQPAHTMLYSWEEVSDPSGAILGGIDSLDKQLLTEGPPYVKHKYTAIVSGTRSRIECVEEHYRDLQGAALSMSKKTYVFDGARYRTLREPVNQSDNIFRGHKGTKDLNSGILADKLFGTGFNFKTDDFITKYNPRIIDSDKAGIILLELTRPERTISHLEIDPGKGFNVTKATIYNDNMLKLWECVIEFRKTSDGIWAPKAKKVSNFFKGKLRSGSEAKYDLVESDIEISDDMFTLEFPVGTRVYDSLGAIFNITGSRLICVTTSLLVVLCIPLYFFLRKKIHIRT